MRYTIRDENFYHAWYSMVYQDIQVLFLNSYRMRQLSNGLLSRVVWPNRGMNVACGNLVPRGISKVMCLWSVKAVQNKKHVNRDTYIASSPISQSSFFKEVWCLILASSQRKLRGYIEYWKLDVTIKKKLSKIKRFRLTLAKFNITGLVHLPTKLRLLYWPGCTPWKRICVKKNISRKIPLRNRPFGGFFSNGNR